MVGDMWAKSLFPIDVSAKGFSIIRFVVRKLSNDDGCAKRRSSFNFFSALCEQLWTQSPAIIVLRLLARFGSAEIATCLGVALLFPVSFSAFLIGSAHMLSIPSILHLSLLHGAAPSLKEPHFLMQEGR